MYAGPRATLDIDIVVDEAGLLRRLEEFCQAFPPPRYYADPEALRESLQDGYMNNILDTDSGVEGGYCPPQGASRNFEGCDPPPAAPDR